MANTPERINPREAQQHLAAGALLVCAYDSPEKCEQNRLEGAIPLSDFRARADSLPREQEIIFYCA